MEPQARALACEALWLDAARPDALARLVVEADAQAFVELARRSAVLPTVAWTLAHHRLLDRIAPAARAELREALERNAVQNAQLLSDLAAFVGALDDAGIDSIALKGAALLAADARAVASRHTDDIDLLVDDEHAERARAIALALGYRERSHPTRLDHDGKPAPASHHLPGLVSPGGTPLELHWRVGLARDRGRARLAAHARRVRVRNTDVAVPSVDELATQLCTHVLYQHGAGARFLPRHLHDLYVLGTLDRAAQAVRRFPVLLSIGLAHAARQSTGSLARRIAESLLFPQPGALQLEDLMRPAWLATTFEGVDRRSLVRRLFPSRAYVAHLYGIAPDAPLWKILQLYVRRLGRIPGTRE